MADLLTQSAITMTTINAAAEQPATTAGPSNVPKSKPEKPDEKLFKEAVAKAEREHAVAQDKVVCHTKEIFDMLLICTDHPSTPVPSSTNLVSHTESDESED